MLEIFSDTFMLATMSYKQDRHVRLRDVPPAAAATRRHWWSREKTRSVDPLSL